MANQFDRPNHCAEFFRRNNRQTVNATEATFPKPPIRRIIVRGRRRTLIAKVPAAVASVIAQNG